MNIFIRLFQAQTFSIEVEPTDTIHDVMKKIEEKEGIKVAHQRLVYGQKQLAKEDTLEAFQIDQDSTLHLAIRVPGG